MPKKVVVIGGGLAGLTTAALLAKQGFAVTVVEKNRELGGRARVLREGGFTFDMGPSWYLMPEVMDEVFQVLGHTTQDFYTLKALKTKYKIFSEDQAAMAVTDDMETNYSLFEQIDPTSKTGIAALIQKTSVAYDLVMQTFLHRPYQSPADFLNFSAIVSGLRLLTLLNPFQSYHDFVKKYVKNPDLQKIFEFHTVFLGGNPFQTPALYSMLIAADFKQKVWYPMGGVGELVKALETIARKLGVTFLTETAVTSLTIEHQKVVAVNSAAQSLPADIVVNTMDYASFDQTILPQAYQEYDKKYWEERDYSISSILLYLGINKKIPELAHHNFFFQKDWQLHFDTLKTSQLPKHPCFYISAPSVTDPTVAPKNKENLFVLIPTSVKTVEKNLPKYIDHVLDHIEKVIGVKFKADICYQKVYSKKDFAADYAAYKGNALGLSHTLGQSVFLRPRMKAKHLSNLYYAGQFTQPGVGVPMVLLSALYMNDILKNAKI